ncbi:MAG TPA: hypothetical protein VN896_09810 [Methylomirabilota bacterium]|nr:hypothetical protein [Methylomirabilota bacterium]
MRHRLLAALALVIATGCGGTSSKVKLGPAETFNWVAQPVAFSPPPSRWYRQGDNGGGLLGVRFILTGGGGQCISVYAHRLLAERDRREAIAKLISRRDSLSRREFLDELSLVRPRTEDPISARESATAQAINEAVDRAMRDYFDEQPGFVAADLDAALRAASSYQPTLTELLPHIRLRPERMQEPGRWKIAYEHDTTLAGHLAFASDDTLFTPERPLLYREIFWVVNGCAFKAVYQGTAENLPTFAQVVDSIDFPEGADVAAN